MLNIHIDSKIHLNFKNLRTWCCVISELEKHSSQQWLTFKPHFAELSHGEESNSELQNPHLLMLACGSVHVGVAWDCHLLDDSQCGLSPARKTAMSLRGRASLAPTRQEDTRKSDYS